MTTFWQITDRAGSLLDEFEGYSAKYPSGTWLLQHFPFYREEIDIMYYLMGDPVSSEECVRQQLRFRIPEHRTSSLLRRLEKRGLVTRTEVK